MHMVYYKIISCVWQNSIHGLCSIVALLYNITSSWISKFWLGTNGLINFRFTGFLLTNLRISNNFRISRYLLNSKCIISFRRLCTSSVTRIPIAAIGWKWITTLTQTPRYILRWIMVESRLPRAFEKLPTLWITSNMNIIYLDG